MTVILAKCSFIFVGLDTKVKTVDGNLTLQQIVSKAGAKAWFCDFATGLYYYNLPVVCIF